MKWIPLFKDGSSVEFSICVTLFWNSAELTIEAIDIKLLSPS